MKENSLPAWLPWALFLLLALALVLNLGLPAWYNEEPRRALVGMEMLLTGEWLVPRIAGEYYYKLPPLFSWVVATIMKLSGSQAEWTSRIVSVMSLLLSALLLKVLAQRYLEKALAWPLALLFAVGGHMLFYASVIGEIDPFFMLITAVGIFGFYRLIHDRDQRFLAYLWIYGWASVGFLTKSIPAMPFAFLTVVAYHLVQKNPLALLNWRHILGGTVFFLILGTYFFAYSFNHPVEPYLTRLITHVGERSEVSHGFWAVVKHIVLFPFDLLLRMMPISLGFLAFLKRDIRKGVFGNKFLRFCLLAAGLNLLIYWFSPGSRPRYLFPVHPLLALPAGYALLLWLRDYRAIGLLWLGRLLPFAAMALAGVGVYFGQKEYAYLPSWPWLFALFLPLFCLLKQPTWFRLVLSMVFLRLAFDALALPIRAIDADAAKFKAEALEIAGLTAGAKVMMAPDVPEYYQLRGIVYLTREKQAVIGFDKAGEFSDQSGVFYLTERPEDYPEAKVVKQLSMWGPPGGFTLIQL